MPPKRTSDELPQTDPKRRKKSSQKNSQNQNDARLSEEINQKADEVLQCEAKLTAYIQKLRVTNFISTELGRQMMSVYNCWQMACELAKDPTKTWTKAQRDLLDLRLPDDGRSSSESSQSCAHSNYRSIFFTLQ
jgi:hypothetical protein